jgi:D-alanine--D-alanine ligase
MEQKKIRVAVLLGGASNEKETSLDSGRNVFYKLSSEKYNAIAIFVSDSLQLYKLTQSQLVRNSTKEIVELLQESQKIKWSDLPIMFDFVFNALHGGEGENGSVQGALEILGLPYNGSSVLASALCMNKYKTNQLLAMNGFNVPRHVYVTKEEWFSAQENVLKSLRSLGEEEIVKPHDDGCSVMVQKVTNDNELIAAIETVLQQKDAVLIEECITGMELTVGVIGNNTVRALPPSQAISTHGILSIEEKFLPGAGENQTPAALPVETLRFVQDVIEKVYTTMQCRGYARIDCFYQNAEQSATGKERVVILEINTLPGLTPATCLFHQAAEINLTPMEFIDTIIALGFEEHAKENIREDSAIYLSLQEVTKHLLLT